MLPFLLKVFILGISLKLYASVTEFCYKCDGFCTIPPNAEWCNKSIDNKPVCVVKRNPVEKRETRSCMYPKTQSANITECNKTDDGLCMVCEGNFCNIPIKRKIKGASRCYYCRGVCKNPLETADCYYLQNVCLTAIKSVENEMYDYDMQEYVKKTEIFIYRGCRGVEANETANSDCKNYNKGNWNCTVCNTTMCNRLPYDPPDPTPYPQLTANLASVCESYRSLLKFSIYFVTFIIK